MTDSRPNLLVILCDQLRRSAVGCYGDPHGATPHLDALAQRGVRFDAAVSSYPICVPFRFTLLTGHMAHSRMVPGINWRMSPAERTLADDFNDAGYDTLYVGKWHLYGGLGGWSMKKPIPRNHQGRWQTFLGFEFRNDFFDNVCFRNDDPTPVPVPGYQTDGLFDLTMQELRGWQARGERRPFACVLSVEAPHPPIEAPPAYEQKWAQRTMQLPPTFMQAAAENVDMAGGCLAAGRMPDADMLRLRQTYYAMVDNLDTNVGRMMAFLRQSGLADNTIVVFVSDHGEMHGAHGLMHKQYPFEDSCGIPLLMCGPGLASGQRISDPACSEDLFPTLLGLCGLKPGTRETLYGEDLSALARGERSTAPSGREGVMLEFVQETRPGVAFQGRPYRGIRTRRYKYTVIGAADRSGRMQPWHLFDLEQDPHETRNLIHDPAHAQTAAHLHGLLRQRMVQTLDHAWLDAAFGHETLNATLVDKVRG